MFAAVWTLATLRFPPMPCGIGDAPLSADCSRNSTRTPQGGRDAARKNRTPYVI